MPSLNYDLIYLKTSSAELEEYLLSNVLYWPIGARPPKGEPPFPRLTLGGMFLARSRISVHASDGSLSSTEIQAIDDRITNLRTRWRGLWEGKVASEFSSRLRQWENFLNEYYQDPGLRAAEYTQNVQQRVILQLLNAEPGVDEQASRSVLTGLDGALRNSFSSGEFCWEGELQPAFPPREFWYLYGSLRPG